MFSLLKKHAAQILLIPVIFLYFFFGFQHLEQFITADEHYWVYERIPEYWDALAKGKLKNTFINDKPGISLALVSGIGYSLHPDSPTLCFENKDKLFICKTDQTAKTYRDFRLPILILNGLLLFLSFFLISKLTHPWVALWATILTALSPILLGISQIVNPDSLLWSFGSIAILSFFALLQCKEKKFLWLTIIFTGLALLSKYTALILFPFFLLLILLSFLSDKGEMAETLRADLKKNLIRWLIIVVASLALLCFFFPALLISPSARTAFLLTIPDEPILLLVGMTFFVWLIIDTYRLQNKHLFFIRTLYQNFCTPLSRTVPLFFLLLFVFLILARNFFPQWSIFALIPFDIKDISDARYVTDIPNFLEVFLLEWNPLIFSLTPITLVGLAGFFIASFKKNAVKHSFLTNSLLLFTALFTVLLIFSNVLATPRYSILLYPIFSLLAGLGTWHITENISLPYRRLVATMIIFFGSYMSLITIKPFYFNYTNILLPKSALINDAWGYGGYEAAAYLNSLPDAERLTIWADYYGVCEFFIGKCLTAYTFDREKVQPEYYVLTRRGQIRYMARYLRWEEKSGLIAYKYYATENPDWQLFIDNRPKNFIKVVKIAK